MKQIAACARIRFCPESAGPECDLPCGTQAEGIGHRRPYYPSCGLRDEHSHAPAHRIYLWLDEDRGWDAENPIPWLGAGQPALLHRGRRLQSGTYGSTGSGLMGVLRPESRKWSGKAVKTAKTGLMPIRIHPFSNKSVAATGLLPTFPQSPRVHNGAP